METQAKYEIARSNSLSRDVMKMYLYNIVLLGHAQMDAQNEIRELEEKATMLNKKKCVIEAEKRVKESDLNYSTLFLIISVGISILCIILLGFAVYLHKNSTVVIGIIVVCVALFVAAIITFLCFILFIYIENKYKNKINKKNAEIRACNEQKIKDFADKRNQQLEVWKARWEELKSQKLQIENELQRQYDMAYLHKNYQNWEICGIFYQLFDTGRVSNLTEAMNLYEDLKWKGELSYMLRSLKEGVDRLIDKAEEITYNQYIMLQNEREKKRLLEGIAMNQQRILDSNYAIAENQNVIEGSLRTMEMLQTFDYLDRQ